MYKCVILSIRTSERGDANACWCFYLTSGICQGRAGNDVLPGEKEDVREDASTWM